MAKRFFDLLFSIAGLAVLWPVMLVVGVLVRIEDGGPALFRQIRVGLGGEDFELLKFRSMGQRKTEDAGSQVTAGGDPRITQIGAVLRKTKLDELPQLINVFRGDMSFVGPRPEVRRFVDLYTEKQRQVLQLKPGITDLATLIYRNEEDILAKADDPERFYIDEIMPEKLRLNLDYADKAGVVADVAIIFRTLVAILRR